jgi:hypothetical protein
MLVDDLFVFGWQALGRGQAHGLMRADQPTLERFEVVVVAIFHG